MTSRTDVLQDFNESPRISTVEAPSVEMSAQDLVDTLRITETQFQATTYPRLIDADGKAPLSAVESTAITVTQRNNVIEFEARRTPAETGTITTQGLTDARGLVQLIDAAADFVAANVQPGSFIINFSDLSVTDVRRVVGTGQLECKALVNGTGDTFEVGDVYHVFNIVQCEVLGGNVIAVDVDGVTPIPAFLPSAFTQIVALRNAGSTLINGSADDFWDALLADHVVAGSFGEWVGKKLLTVVKFLGLK